MTASYVAVSIMWAVYGLVLGYGLGSVARLVWTNLPRK